MILKIFITFTLLVSLSSATTSVVDYCVADLSLPVTPAGYPCRNPANLTVDDFVFSGLTPANKSNIFRANATFAFDATFPALNGLGISMARLDMDVGGVVPVHSHRVSELIILIQGRVVAGFIDSNNRPFYTVLNPGDIMIFPQTLLHFQWNNGTTPALAYASFNSQLPGIQSTTLSLFANGLPTEIVERISLIGEDEARRLKQIFGATN